MTASSFMGSSGSSYYCWGCVWGWGFPPSRMAGVCCLGGCKIPSGSLIRVPISQLRRLGSRYECGQSAVREMPLPLVLACLAFQFSRFTHDILCPMLCHHPPSSEHHWPHLWLGLSLQLYISHLGTNCQSPPSRSPTAMCPSHCGTHRNTLFPSGCRKKSCLLRPH